MVKLFIDPFTEIGEKKTSVGIGMSLVSKFLNPEISKKINADYMPVVFHLNLISKNSRKLRHTTTFIPVLTVTLKQLLLIINSSIYI